MKYSDQTQHPLWQKKRLETLERDGWACRCCGNKESMLQVHHLYYIPNTMIWDYDNEALVSLCYFCHGIIHADLAKISGLIAFKILSEKIDILDISAERIGI